MKRIKTKEIKYKYNLLDGFALGDNVRYQNVLGLEGHGVIVALALDDDDGQGICIATTCKKFNYCEGMKSVKYNIKFSDVIYNKKVIKKLLKKNDNGLYLWWVDRINLTKVDELA